MDDDRFDQCDATTTRGGYERCSKEADHSGPHSFEVDLLASTDPEVWAKTFAEQFEHMEVGVEVDEEALTGWFANAFQAKETAMGSEPYRFSLSDLHELVFLVAGAATAPLMRDSGLVMPTEEVIDGVNRILDERGLPTSDRKTVEPLP